MSEQKEHRVADYLPRKLITPITGALSLVIGISGVMLFFHIEEGLVKEIHEWLGMAFAATMLAHLAINWNAFTKHFKKPTAWVTTGIVTAISTIFLVTALSNPGKSPMHKIIYSIETTAVVDLAPVFKISESEIIQRLDQAGVEIKTGQETLQQLAENSGVNPRKLIASLVDSANQDSGR